MNDRQVDAAEIDYEEGLQRFSNRADLYEKYLLKFMSEDSFREMQLAFVAKDYEATFKHAHNLKGLTGNLSLNRLYRLLIPFVQALREQPDIASAGAIYPELEAVYLSTTAAIEKILK